MKMEGFVTTTLIVSTLLQIVSADIPWFIEEPKSTIVKQRGNVTINCKVAPPSATVRWTFDGKPLDTNNRYEITDNSLTIKSFLRDKHEGTYHCVATTSAGSILSGPATLSRPEFGQFPPNAQDIYLDIMEGETAVIPCSRPVSKPPATFFFKHKDVPVSEDVRHRLMPSGAMQIAGIQKSEGGVYQCVARNPISGQERTSPTKVTVNVKDPYVADTAPYIDNDEETVATTLGGEVILECVARGSPPLRYTWSKYGGLLPADHSQQFLGNLKITNIKLWDQGTYMCTASNGYGQNVEKIVHVEVKAQPVLTITNPNQNVRIGESIEIKCNVKKQKNTITGIDWYHNATKIYSNRYVTVKGNTLSIQAVRPKHAGLYQCTTESSVGFASARARIEISPAGPTNTTPGGLTNIQTRSGKSIQLVCPTKSAIRWVSEIESPRARTLKNGTLMVVNAKVVDSGLYRCQGLDGTVVQTYQLTVVDDKYGQSDGSSNQTLPRKAKKNNKPKRQKTKGPSDMIPPSKPTVTKLSDTSVMLDWTVPDNKGLKITFFRIQYKRLKPQKSVWFTNDEEIAGNKRRSQVEKLEPGSVYKFRIAAVFSNNDNKHGENSDRFSLEQELAPELKPPPINPTIVKVEPLIHKNNYALHVLWQYLPKDSFAQVLGFNLEYKPHYSPVEYSAINLDEPGIRSFVLKDLKPDTSYDIRVNCFNKVGSSRYSNKVVKHTLGPVGDAHPKPYDPKPPSPYDPKLPSPYDSKNYERQTKKPPILPTVPRPDKVTDKPTTLKSSVAYETKNSTQNSNEMLYMVLGIVLGILMLLLVIFMVMCGIRQRQNRRMANDLITAKYQDPAQRIYSDNQDKYKNGGGFFLSHLQNGTNGHMANGHMTNGGRGVNINVNPMSEYETQTQIPNNVAEQPTLVMTPSLNQQRTSDGTYNSIDESPMNHTYTAPPPTYSVLSPQPLSSFGMTHRPIDPAPPPVHRSTPSSSPSYTNSNYTPTSTYHNTATPYAQSAVPHTYPGGDYDSDESREFHSLMRQRQQHEQFEHPNDRVINERMLNDRLTNDRVINDRLNERLNDRLMMDSPTAYNQQQTTPGLRHNRRPRQPKTVAPSHDAATLNMMRDQATNTDISSSNEGTIDDSSLSRLHDYDSPSNSLPHRHHSNNNNTDISPRYCRDSAELDYRIMPQNQLYQYDSDAMTDT